MNQISPPYPSNVVLIDRHLHLHQLRLLHEQFEGNVDQYESCVAILKYSIVQCCCDVAVVQRTLAAAYSSSNPSFCRLDSYTRLFSDLRGSDCDRLVLGGSCGSHVGWMLSVVTVPRRHYPHPVHRRSRRRCRLTRSQFLASRQRSIGTDRMGWAGRFVASKTADCLPPSPPSYPLSGHSAALSRAAVWESETGAEIFHGKCRKTSRPHQ